MSSIKVSTCIIPGWRVIYKASHAATNHAVQEDADLIEPVMDGLRPIHSKTGSKRVFLTHARRLDGHNILIGDNLASHFNNAVTTMCQENGRSV